MIYRENTLKFRNKTLLDVFEEESNHFFFRKRHLLTLDGFNFIIIHVYALQLERLSKLFVTLKSRHVRVDVYALLVGVLERPSECKLGF